jgi:hypothetical protein
MTFTDALEALAGKYPEKFDFPLTRFFWSDGHREIVVSDSECRITQDDIDEILGLIGWEYEVRFLVTLNEWFYSIWSERIVGAKIDGSVHEGKPTKLLAAQAALIAVTERVTP